jgi:cobalt/nickel transport system permease protein
MRSLENGLYDLGRLDRFAAGDTWVHRLDPRAKVMVTGVYLVCVVSFGKYALAPLFPFLLFPVAMAAAGGVPLGFLARKVVTVAPFALLVGAFNPLVDRTPILWVAGVSVAAGWVSFASIMLRFVATTLAALVLVATTGMTGVGSALERLGVPRVLATQLLLMYRYLFVLGAQTMRMARARALRSFGGRGMGLGAYVNIVGHLLVRSFARAHRIYQAMLGRGFDGRIRSLGRLRFTGADAAFVIGWSAAFVALRTYDVSTMLGRTLMELVA